MRNVISVVAKAFLDGWYGTGTYDLYMSIPYCSQTYTNITYCSLYKFGYSQCGNYQCQHNWMGLKFYGMILLFILLSVISNNERLPS